MAAWIPCPCCENYWCLLHGQHAHDCPCPPVEEWDESPYGANNSETESRPRARPKTAPQSGPMGTTGVRGSVRSLLTKPPARATAAVERWQSFTPSEATTHDPDLQPPRPRPVRVLPGRLRRGPAAVRAV